MPSRPQYRAGREVAEDVKRAVRHAVHHVGLEEHKVRMVLGANRSIRLVYGGGKPQGWPHEQPPVFVEVFVETNGDILPVTVFCLASDQDPARAAAGGALEVQACLCELKDLPQVLKELWAERQTLVGRQKVGEQIRSYTGRFRWQWRSIEDAVNEQQ